MAQRNDDELAFYLADLVRTAGHINDQERDWYLSKLAPYTGAMHINDIWQAYWLSLGIAQGSVNDMAYAWLVSLGIPAGHISDMWHAYFEGPSFPAIMSTADVWMDQSQLLITGTDVTGWTNMGVGGVTYDLISQSSGVSLPQVGVQNGLQMIDNDPSPDRVWLRSTGGIAIPQPYTIVVVAAMQNDPGVRSTLLDSFTGGPTVKIDGNTGDTSFGMEAGGTRLTVSPWNNLPHVFVAVFDGANSSLEVSGIGSSAIANAGTNSLSYVTLGAQSNDFQSWLGAFGEFLVFNSAVPQIDRTDMIDFLKLKWATQ